MSLGSIMSIARTAMTVHQNAVQTASQNISNVSTEGYTRQRVNLQAATPQQFPTYTIGMGVALAGIERTRDTLLDATYRGNASTAEGYATTRDLMTEINGILGEPSDNGLGSTLDAFWSSWGDLASDPTSSAARGVVRQRGTQLAGTLNDFAKRLDDLDQRSREDLNTKVDLLNHLTKQVAELNPRIVAAESGRSSANDLRDDRDRALDQISKLSGAQIVERTDGSVGVYIGGRLIADASDYRPLEVVDGQPPTIAFQGTTSDIAGIGGSLGATIDGIATKIPSVMSKLDALAKGVVETVNAIHSTGTVWTGTPPVSSPAGNFFEVTTPAPVAGDPLKTARGITLAATLASANDVAASGAGATGPGNNDVANALASLRETAATFTDPTGGTTLATATVGDYYRTIVSSVATDTSDATDSATVHESLTANASAKRQAADGVSTDEELISVIQSQHSYSAAARLVSVVDDMMKSLVELGR